MTRTILVADDSPTVQRRASGILQGEGIEVVTVSNGVAAIKKLSTAHPLLILADVSMPGKDGYEVCEHVKNAPELSHIAVLLMYSEDDPFEEQRAARVRADGRVKKPFDERELATVAHRYLNQAEAESSAAADAMARTGRSDQRTVAVIEPVDLEPQFETQKGPDPASFTEAVAFSVPYGEEASPIPAPATEAESVPTPEQLPEQPPIVERDSVVEAIPVREEEQPAPEPPIETTRAETYGESPATAPEAVPVEQPVLEPPTESVVRETYGKSEATAAEPVSDVQPITEFHAPPEMAEDVVEEEAKTVIEPSVGEQVAQTSTEPALTESAAEVSSPPRAEMKDEAATEASSATETPAPESQWESEPEIASAPAVSEPPGPEAALPPTSDEEVPPPQPPTIYAEFVYAVVHRTVVKMAPRALSPQTIEDMARRLANEILREMEFPQ